MSAATWWPRIAHRLPPWNRMIRVVVSLLLLVAIYVVSNRFLNMARSLDRLASFDAAYLPPILLLSLVYYLLKAVRWHYYLLVARVRVGLVRSVAAYLAGQWFTFTPAGELMRAYLLGAGTSFAAVAPTVVMQAAIDFVSLALMATLAVPLYPALAPIVLPVTVPLLLTTVMISAPPLRRYASTWRLLRWLVSGRREAMLGRIGELTGPRPVAVGLLFGVPTVLSGGLALYLAGVAVALPQWNLLYANTVYAMIQLVGGVSPLPQGLGVTEGSGTLMLGYLGIDPALALAAILLFRASVLGFSAVLGLVAFLVLRLTVPELAGASMRGAGTAAREGELDGPTRAPGLP